MGKKIPGGIMRYLVLESCMDGPSYGYEVVSRIEDVTGGHWSPSYGTVYPLIQRLTNDGFLKELSEEDAEKKGLDDGDRKYFELTDKGREKLEEVSQKEDEYREKFESLIRGYLRIYGHKYGEDALNDLKDDI